MLNNALGQLHFWVTFLGTYAVYYPMHYLGFIGVPPVSYTHLTLPTIYSV